MILLRATPHPSSHPGMKAAGASTSCCLTRAELLEEGVSSHLQSGRAGEAPTQGDVTGYHGAEARHRTTCRNRRKKGAVKPAGLGAALPHSSQGTVGGKPLSNAPF